MDTGVDTDLERFVFVGFFIGFSLLLINHEAVSATPRFQIHVRATKKRPEIGRYLLRKVLGVFVTSLRAQTMAQLIHSFCWHQLAAISLLPLRRIPQPIVFSVHLNER